MCNRNRSSLNSIRYWKLEGCSGLPRLFCGKKLQVEEIQFCIHAVINLWECCRYYSATILQMAGVEDTSTAIWLASLTAFVNFAFTFVGLFLVERIGRRPLTLGSLTGEPYYNLIM